MYHMPLNSLERQIIDEYTSFYTVGQHVWVRPYLIGLTENIQIWLLEINRLLTV